MMTEDRLAPESRMKRFQRSLDIEGCMSFNPFFRDISQQELLRVFGEVSQGMTQACKELVLMSGVMHPVRVSDQEVSDKVADILNDVRKSNYGPEMFLAPAFINAVKTPYILMDQIAQGEMNGKDASAGAVADVLEGLKEIKVFAEAVPLVYEAIYAYQAPDRAVA